MTRFLKNAWYMVAWAEEVPPSGLLARTICEQPLVIYRSDQDQLACLLDRCPHRFAPLSMGRLEGRSLRCGYHGVKFGPDGRCEENPHGTLVSALSVRAFPIVERHKILWTWLGEAKDADPARIPDLGFIDHAPSTALITGYLPTGANHLLLVDNILDLTHADYLHPESLGRPTSRSQRGSRPGPHANRPIRPSPSNHAMRVRREPRSWTIRTRPGRPSQRPMKTPRPRPTRPTAERKRTVDRQRTAGRASRSPCAAAAAGCSHGSANSA